MIKLEWAIIIHQTLIIVEGLQNSCASQVGLSVKFALLFFSVKRSTIIPFLPLLYYCTFLLIKHVLHCSFIAFTFTFLLGFNEDDQLLMEFPMATVAIKHCFCRSSQKLCPENPNLPSSFSSSSSFSLDVIVEEVALSAVSTSLLRCLIIMGRNDSLWKSCKICSSSEGKTYVMSLYVEQKHSNETNGKVYPSMHITSRLHFYNKL